METIVAIVGAFFFYLVFLPLYGLLVGVFVRVLFPYFCFGLLIYLLGIGPRWYLLAGAWLIAVLVMRRRIGRYRTLHWTEGHYQSARKLLSLDLPVPEPAEEWAPPEGRPSSIHYLQGRR